MDVIGIPNAAWWLPHSTVVVKEDYTAGDMAWIMNSLVRLDANNQAQVTGKHQNIVTIQRMVQPGSTVAVTRANGRVKTVQLPQEVTDLLDRDMDYIIEQLNKLQEPPMTQDEQEAFPMPVGASSQAI